VAGLDAPKWVFPKKAFAKTGCGLQSSGPAQRKNLFDHDSPAAVLGQIPNDVDKRIFVGGFRAASTREFRPSDFIRISSWASARKENPRSGGVELERADPQIHQNSVEGALDGGVDLVEKIRAPERNENQNLRHFLGAGNSRGVAIDPERLVLFVSSSRAVV
jgi:hypothetical protein